MGRRVFIIGVGMTKFEKPGKRDWDYPDMGRIAAERALEDATISYKEIDQVACGYCYGDSTCGQRAVYQLGMTGVPVYNVNNNCSTGSTALHMAKQFVAGGTSECVMALGFEKMKKGSLGSNFNDRVNPIDKHFGVMLQLEEFEKGPPAAQMFGNAGREHQRKYGTKDEHFAKIAEKNHRHSALNPYSQFRTVYSLDEIKASPMMHKPLTKLQCCPTSDGGACAIVASEDFVRKHGLEGQAVEIAGQALTTDMPSALDEDNPSNIKMVGFDMARNAADKALAEAKVSAKDVQVVELHDCFSANELVTYEALRLCDEGKAAEFIEAGDNDYGGRVVVNPSGGLISKGHPLGATGLAQAAEMVWQLRQECGERQVKGAEIAMSHNLGLGGACVVTVYKRPREWRGKPMKRKITRARKVEGEPAASGASRL